MTAVDWRSGRTQRLIFALALTAIVAYGAMLRLHALFDTHGPYERPAWLRTLQPAVMNAQRLIGPDWSWPKYQDLYSGGDPRMYLEFAREMTRFYQPHVREPAFLASVKAGVAVAGGEDVGISLVSIGYSLLMIVATCLLGAELFSRGVGLAAAAALAIEHEAISWAFGGWRDEAFAGLSLLAVWLWIRVARAPAISTAAWAGIATGLACLTRLTAPFMIAPAILAVVLTRDWRARRRPFLAGTLIAAAIVLPYLIACAVEYGDPFYAINYHTQFYLDRSGQSPRIMPATSFVLDTWRQGPINALDTTFEGAFVYPFVNKWRGLDVWIAGLGTTLAVLSVAGLVLWVWTPGRRVLVAVLFCSLVPYLATWKIVGGSEWRFTLHVYPLYLLAAFSGIGTIAAQVRRWPMAAAGGRTVAKRAAATTAAVVIAVWWAYSAPVWIAREALASGRPAILNVSRRDWRLFPSGWSPLATSANVTARFSVDHTAIVRLPLPERRAYDLLLRVDPIPVGATPIQRVRVFLNQQPLSVLQLTWDPQSVGRYTIHVPKELVVVGANELSLRPDVTVDAAVVADRYPEIAGAGQVGFRLWYVMVTPVGGASGN